MSTKITEHKINLSEFLKTAKHVPHALNVFLQLLFHDKGSTVLFVLGVNLLDHFYSALQFHLMLTLQQRFEYSDCNTVLRVSAIEKNDKHEIELHC